MSELPHPENVKPTRLKLLDASMCAQLKKLGYDAYEHRPHWTFAANKDRKLMERLYSIYIDLEIDFITTNTYHFGSSLDTDLPKELCDPKIYEAYFKNACDVLETMLDAHNKESNHKIRALGSVGTFATRYHDCSEYNGRYIEQPNALEEAYNYFHHIFQTFLKYSSIRTLLVETVPTETEARAIICLLDQFPEMNVIMSFSIKENALLRHGEQIHYIARQMKKYQQIIGIGINCTDPQNVLPALKEIQPYHFEHVFVYPNIGDQHFISDEEVVGCPFTFDLVKSWVDHGATVFGGCCGVEDTHLKVLKSYIEQLNKIK